MRFSVCLTFIFQAALSAQPQGACPIQFGSIIPGAVLRPHGAFVFALSFKNVGSKDIRGFKVQTAHFDATEDLHVIPLEWGSHRPVKAGKVDTAEWESPYRNEIGVGWIVVVKKVLFEDGSTWVGSAEQPCYIEQWKDKKHPRLTKLPWELFKVAP